jgi:hypothetical protein
MGGAAVGRWSKLNAMLYDTAAGWSRLASLQVCVDAAFAGMTLVCFAAPSTYVIPARDCEHRSAEATGRRQMHSSEGPHFADQEHRRNMREHANMSAI